MTDAQVIQRTLMEWPLKNNRLGVPSPHTPIWCNSMAKLQTLNYMVSLDDIAMSITQFRPNILPSAIPQLAVDIKQMALLHACAFLGSGGILRWKNQSSMNLIGELARDIRTMAVGVSVSTDSVWQRDSRHPMTTNWAISLDDWAIVSAVFAYHLINTILTSTVGLVELSEQYYASTLLFSPQHIWQPGGESFFAFSISLFNRELLPTS